LGMKSKKKGEKETLQKEDHASRMIGEYDRQYLKTAKKLEKKK